MSENVIDFTKAIKVTSIKDEYYFVRLHPCLCGGTFRPVSQSLVTGPQSMHYDLISAQCMTCKREHVFVFDIDTFLSKR